MTREERNVAAEILWKIIVINFVGFAVVLWLQWVYG